MSSNVPLALFEPDVYNSSKGTWSSKQPIKGSKQKKKKILRLAETLNNDKPKNMSKLRFKSSKLGGIKPQKSDFIITPSMHRTNFITKSKGKTVAFNYAGLAQERVYQTVEPIVKATEIPNDDFFPPFTPGSLNILPSRGLTATSASSYRQHSTRGSLVYETNLGNNVTTGANVQLNRPKQTALDALFRDDVSESMLHSREKDPFDVSIEINFSEYMHNKSLRRNAMTSSTVDSSSALSSSWNNDSRYGGDFNSRQSDITRLNTATMNGDEEFVNSDEDDFNETLDERDIMSLSINTIKEKNKKMKNFKHMSKSVTNIKQNKHEKEIERETAMNEERERKLMSKEEWQSIMYDNIAASTNNSWRTIKIFVSSTFNDMHGERDVINKEVIPDLNELLRCQRIKVVAIDLRWGLTREDTSDTGLGALEHCLHEIDSTRPFFVMLVGERYGWIPKKYRVSNQKKFNWIKTHSPGNSITAMEAYHAFLNNPHKPIHAFCYKRDSNFIQKIRNKKERAVFEFDYPRREKVKKMREKLLNDIKAHPYCKCRHYRGHYGGTDRYGRPYIAGLQKTFGMPLLKDLYRAIQFHFPKAMHIGRMSKTLNLSPTGDRHSSNVSINQSDSFQIKQEMSFDDVSCGHVHKKFIDYRVMLMIKRPLYLKQMHEFLNANIEMGDNGKNVLLLTGEPGCGKTSLVCSFVDDCAKNHRDNVIVVSYLVGGGPNSNDEEGMLRVIGEKLIALFHLSLDLDIKYANILHWFSKVVTAAGEKAVAQDKLILIAIDGIDQIDTTLQSNSYQWIPKSIVKGCIFLVSCTTNNRISHLSNESERHLNLAVKGLTVEQQKKMIEQILLSSHKKLTDAQYNLIVEKQDAVNPLYLQILCEELILGGQYGIDGSVLDSMISNFPDTLEELLSCVLNRIEEDMHDHCSQISLLSPSKSDFTGALMVERAMCFLACSRQGLEELALQKLIHPGWEFGNKLPEVLWSRLHRSLAVYLQPRGFQRGSNKLKFYRRELIPAIKKKYLQNSTKLHIIHKDSCRFLTIKYKEALREGGSNRFNYEHMAANSSKRSLHFEHENVEDILDIIYHQIHAIDIKGLRSTLGNLQFIEKCFISAAMFKDEGIIASLLQFYRTAYCTISTALPAMRAELLIQANTNLHDIKWWFEQMWWFLATHHYQILRSPLLLYQFALNFVSDSAPEKMSRLKSSEKYFFHEDWLWVMRRDTHNIWNAEHVKIDIKYELPVLIVGKNEIVFSASDGGLQTCFVSTFGKSDEKKSNLQDFFNGEKSKIQLGESNKMIISSIELSNDKQIIVTRTSDGYLSIWSNKKKICLFSTKAVFPTSKSSEFKIINPPANNEAKNDAETYEYIITSVSDNRTSIFFWKVKFNEHYLQHYYSLQENNVIVDADNIKMYLAETLPIPANTEVLSLNALNDGNDIYVILASLNVDDSILFHIQSDEDNLNINMMDKTDSDDNNNNNNEGKAEKIHRILQKNKGLVCVANLEEKNIVATGTLYGKLNIQKMDDEHIYQHNVGGCILALSWHNSKALEVPILICANQQKGIIIWQYASDTHQLIKVSCITSRYMRNFSNSFSITDQFIVTTFGNDYKHGYLYLWDLDKLPNLSLARKRHADIETKGMKENDDNSIDAYTDDGKNLIFLSSISKYKEIIVSCCISAHGVNAATLDGKGDIHIWNTMSNQLLDRLKCQDATKIGMSMNGHYVVAITTGGAVFLWELIGNYIEHGAIGQLGNNKTVTAIAFMESIKRLSIGDSDGHIHLLDLAMKRKINIIQSLLTDGIKKEDALKSWMHEGSEIRDIKFYSKSRIKDKNILASIETPQSGYVSDNGSGYGSDNGSGYGSSDDNEGIGSENDDEEPKKYDIKEHFVLASLSTDGSIKLWSLTSFNILFDQKALFFKSYMKQFMNKAMCQSFLFADSFKRIFLKQTKKYIFEGLIAVDTISAENNALEEKLQWFQLKSMPMTGLLNGATVTCLEVGFKETYIAAGFDDGTVNFYSMTSKKHTASFVCNASVASICLPTAISSGYFIVTDVSGQVYPLHINVTLAREKRVSIKATQAFKNIRTLLKLRKGNKALEDKKKSSSTKKKTTKTKFTSKSIHDFFKGGRSYHVTKKTIKKKNNKEIADKKHNENKEEIDKPSSLVERQDVMFKHNVKLVASLPIHWVPMFDTFELFSKEFLNHGKHSMDKSDIFNFVNICGDSNNLLPVLSNRLEKLIENGLVEATSDHSYIICDGIAKNKLNKMLGKSIDNLKLAISKTEHQIDLEGRIKGPELIAVVSIEGIAKKSPIRIIHDKKIKDIKTFTKVNEIDDYVDKIISVIGCRRWGSRLHAVQTICDHLKYNSQKPSNGICIVISGDREDLENLHLMMKLKVPIIAIVGTGGIADAIFAHREKSKSKYFGWKRLQNRLIKEKSWLSPLEFASSNSNVLKNEELLIEQCGNYNNLHLHDINDSPINLKLLMQRLVEKPLEKMRRAIRRLSNVKRM